MVEVQPASGIPPPHIEREPLDRLPIGQALQPLQDITTATIIGGTDLRPSSANRSANISSGNRARHSRCSTA
ncbi:hypothetical protein [Actinomadura rayongensis]|uniref:hypothetical protein n=1 Tax=Actinomadura rayongensis TaxID=1429076 RepID=UPI00192915C2|nr:hypothetical protein [Actinomadura rayongensis]